MLSLFRSIMRRSDGHFKIFDVRNTKIDDIVDYLLVGQINGATIAHIRSQARRNCIITLQTVGQIDAEQNDKFIIRTGDKVFHNFQFIRRKIQVNAERYFLEIDILMLCAVVHAFKVFVKNNSTIDGNC